MDKIFESIEEWMRNLLTGMVSSNLTNMFTDVNEKTGDIASQVGQTPQGWNSSIFSLIQNLSDSVIVPIAGMIITFVLCYELISMLTEKNNMHDIDTWMFFKYFFKMWIAVWFVSNAFTITMAIFDVGQNVVNRAAGVINQQTAINIDSVITSMETAMESMEVGDTGTGNAPGESVPKGYIRFYNGYFIWPYDRNLSVFVNRCNSVCHYEQPGMGTDWQQLFKRIVCTGISGIFYHGVCGHLFCAGCKHTGIRQCAYGTAQCNGIYSDTVFQSYENS